ncbi:MAG: glycosyl transferase family 1, partial [Bacteroidia bacterium]|nr:glycosyl transferase family 1 [Bacteroidia bacterium]
MKILLLANKIPYPPKDGGSIATYAMAKGFSMNRAEVIVLAMNTRKHFFDISQMPDSVKQIISFKV